MTLLAGVLAFGVAAGGAWWLRRHLLIITVDGESMLPTLRPGDRVLARRTRPSAISAGQVVVIGDRRAARRGESWLSVKRVAACSGDPVPPRLAPHAPAEAAGGVVPPGRVAVLGDNAAESLDSRQCGFVDQDLLWGVLVRPLPATRPERR